MTKAIRAADELVGYIGAPATGHYPAASSMASTLACTRGAAMMSAMSTMSSTTSGSNRLSPSIDRFEQGADVPRKAIAGLSREQLRAHPVPGTWSIHELIVHLYQSDLVAIDRMWRIAAMEKPLIMAYDENAFLRELHPDAIDAALAAEAFSLNRKLLAPVLRALPEASFARAGVHSERGLLTLEQMVEGYVKHLDHHMGFLRDKLQALGRPMAASPGDRR